MNKSVLTNLIAGLIVVAGLTVQCEYQSVILSVGLFALAGGITNWLAIHMLFEKVPGLYGSGVVVNRFEEFKSGIHHLVMSQFFNEVNLARFMDKMVADKSGQSFDFKPIIEQTDFSPVFDGLLDTIMSSSFGGVLSMVGGEEAIKPLKIPFLEKVASSLDDIAHRPDFQSSLKKQLQASEKKHDLFDQVDQIVRIRLEELTPVMVKDIIQTMIKAHLGWLVVWGGVFGGLIGLITGFLPLL